MKKSANIASFIVLLIIIVGISTYYADKKVGMFIDEVYSYGLSNSDYVPFITDLHNGEISDSVLTRKEFSDYLTVQPGEQFHFGSVYYNQTQDVHPPLYYMLLHMVSSFFVDQHTKWIGLSLNLGIFIATLVILYLLLNYSFGNTVISLIGVVLYGLSTIAVSTAILIRMYMLLTFFTVILAYWLLQIIRGRKDYKVFLLVFSSIILGLFTQYYYVYYAFFAAVCTDFFLLVKKRIKDFWIFSLVALSAVAVFVMLYPASINHMFADQLVSGTSVLKTIQDVSSYPGKFTNYLYQFNWNARNIVRTARVFVIPAIICVVLLYKRRHNKDIKPIEEGIDSLVVVVPAVLSFLMIVVSSPVLPLRYIYNLVPLFVCGDCLLINVVFCGFPRGKLTNTFQIGLLVVILGITSYTTIRIEPEYIYSEQAYYTEVAEAYSPYPCIYFDKGRSPAPLTQDMLQLAEYEDVLVVEDTESNMIKEYCDSHTNNDNVVIYIDTNLDERYYSGFDAEMVLSELNSLLGFSQSRHLYTYGGTDVFVLSF